MIDPQVENRVENFKRDWESALSPSPLWTLDGNWPSVGVIDLLTAHLRGRTELGEDEEQLISSSAAYLAIIAHSVWSKFEGNTRVDLNDEGVELSLERGDGEEKRRVVVRIERDMRLFLKELPSPFPVFGEFDRVMFPSDNLVCPYALGVMTGFAPTAEGGIFSKEEEEAAKAQLDTAVKELSRQSAEHYARVWPDEPLGQVPELYLQRLIFPPLMMMEPYPGCEAAGGLLAFFKEYQVGRQAMLSLAANLSRSPDEVISSAGLAVYAALAEEIPSPEIIATAEAKGPRAAALRWAMVLVRQGLGLEPADWTHAVGKAELNAEALLRSEIERRLGMLPWLSLPTSRLKIKGEDERLSRLISGIAELDFGRASRAAQTFLDDKPNDVDMRVQRLHLDAMQGQFELVSQGLQALSTEPEAESSRAFYHLWGMTSLALGDYETAVKHLKKALNLPEQAGVRDAELANNLAWGLTQAGQLEEALEMLETSLSGELFTPVTPLLNKAHVLHRLSRYEEAAIIHKKHLGPLAPTDRRVAAGMIFGKYFGQRSEAS